MTKEEKAEKLKTEIQEAITKHQHKVTNAYCSLLPYDKKHNLLSIKTFKSKSGAIQIFTNFDFPSKRRRKFYKMMSYPLSVRTSTLKGSGKPNYKRLFVSDIMAKETLLHVLESFYSRVFLKECQTQDYELKATINRPTQLNDLLFRDHLQALYLKSCPLMNMIERLLFESVPTNRKGEFNHNGFIYRIKCNELIVNQPRYVSGELKEPLPEEFNEVFKMFWGMSNKGEMYNRPHNILNGKHKAPTLEYMEHRQSIMGYP